MCGENGKIFVDNTYGYGSSPRVRGKPATSPPVRASSRLIPACAGKTGRVGLSCEYHQAHPRVCGENLIRIVKTILADGSSPRVRGKLLPPHHHAVVDRLIPACAGKTFDFDELPYTG